MVEASKFTSLPLRCITTNDSPALAHANVSVSFANGSDIARETADVVLMENSLHGLPEAIAIARQAMQLIHQNTGLVAIPNLSAMLLAVTVGIPPLAATLVNNGSTIVAGLNRLRPLINRDQDLNLLATSLEGDRQIQIFSRPKLDEDCSSEQRTDSFQVAIETDLKTDLVQDSSSSNKQLEDNQQLEDNEQLESNSDLIRDPTQAVPRVLSAKELAERLQVSLATIHRHKSKSNFSTWSQTRDPESIVWTYLKSSKQFTIAE